MKNFEIRCLAVLSFVCVIVTTVCSAITIRDSKTQPTLSKETTTILEMTYDIQPIELTEVEVSGAPNPTIVYDTYTYEEIDLIALVTMAEAEGECDQGKRLVIDTILNRVDSKHFPNTINGVIYQKNQFTSMWNGRVNRCYVSDDIRELVKEEIGCRTNFDVMFFRTGHYSSYGSPMFQVGNHYFSRY